MIIWKSFANGHGRAVGWTVIPLLFLPVLAEIRGPDAERGGGSRGIASASVPRRQKELDHTLAACAAYCRKLSGAVLDFVCEERIEEELYEYYLEAGKEFGSGWLKKRTTKKSYLYDYQMVRRSSGIREDRTLLEENGRKTRQSHASLKTERFYSFQSIYGPIGFFRQDRQGLFDYLPAGRDRMNGIETWVIEVKPKAGLDRLPSGKAWVIPDSGQVLKIERDAPSLEGYGDVLRKIDVGKLTPRFVTVHYYETSRAGILFPSKTTFRESVQASGGRRFQISKTEISFAKYRFFTVQTEDAVIKREAEIV